MNELLLFTSIKEVKSWQHGRWLFLVCLTKSDWQYAHQTISLTKSLMIRVLVLKTAYNHRFYCSRCGWCNIFKYYWKVWCLNTTLLLTEIYPRVMTEGWGVCFIFFGFQWNEIQIFGFLLTDGAFIITYHSNIYKRISFRNKKWETIFHSIEEINISLHKLAHQFPWLLKRYKVKFNILDINSRSL